VQQRTKLFFGEADAAGPIKQHVAMDMGPKREGDLPDVIFLQETLLHRRGDGIRHGIQRGRTASAEIFRETAGASARVGKHVVKDARTRERVVNVALHDRDQPGFGTATKRVSLDVDEQFGEFAVSNVSKKGITVGEVVVNGHGSDANAFGDATHADGFGTFGLKDAEGGLSDAIGGSGVVSHLYIVYYTVYSRKT